MEETSWLWTLQDKERSSTLYFEINTLNLIYVFLMNQIYNFIVTNCRIETKQTSNVQSYIIKKTLVEMGDSNLTNMLTTNLILFHENTLKMPMIQTISKVWFLSQLKPQNYVQCRAIIRWFLQQLKRLIYLPSHILLVCTK